MQPATTLEGSVTAAEAPHPTSGFANGGASGDANGGASGDANGGASGDANGGASCGAKGGATTDEGTGTEDQPSAKFRAELVGVASSKAALKEFMAKSDEYPRYVWENFIRSFQFWQSQELDTETYIYRLFARQKLKHIMDVFPDVLQRELIQDSYHGKTAENGCRRVDSFGALHSAAVCNQLQFVYLLSDDFDSPSSLLSKCFNGLTKRDDSFHYIRRAILWGHMHKDSAQYAEVAKFLQDMEMARNDPGTKLDTLIDKSSERIVYNDTGSLDPWVVILAWASVSETNHRILESFRSRKKEVFKKILKSLRDCASAFAGILENDQNSSTVRQVADVQIYRGILQSALREPDRTFHVSSYHRTQYFVKRFSDKTSLYGWTPLHLAAARGDNEMVSALIRSCRETLTRLYAVYDGHGAHYNNSFTRELGEGFYDANYMTPLHYAILGDHKEVVKSLVEWEVFHDHVNSRDIFMRTALQMACSKRNRGEIASILFNGKVDVDGGDCCLFTPVQWAIHTGCADTAKILIEKGVTPPKGGLVSFIKTAAKKEIQQVLLDIPSVKSEIERLYRDRQVYVDASNAILVGAALIASVTFGGWLQPPLGNEHGSTYTAVRVFWAFSSLSFFFSIATVMAGAGAILPSNNDNMEYAVESIRRWLVVTSSLLVLSVAFVLGAFTAAGYSSLTMAAPDLTANMTLSTSIGSVICAIVGLVFCNRLFRVRADWFNRVVKDALEWLDKEEMLRKFHLLLRGLEKVCRCVIRTSSVEADNPASGPQGSPSLESVLAPVPKIRTWLLESKLPFKNDPYSPPTEVHCERLGKMWKSELHPREGITTCCPIRDLYLELEQHYLHEILMLKGINTEESLQAYITMWDDLNKGPLNE